MNLSEARRFRAAYIAECLLREGVLDPAIFKAFFMAGGPGSGKSFVAGRVLSGHGLMTINSDSAFEFVMKKAGRSLKLDQEGDYDKLRDRAKQMTATREKFFIKERLGLVLDGTGRDLGKISAQKHELEQTGYDCYMVFVNTSLHVALERNKKRERTVSEDLVKEAWQAVQDNIGHFRSMFGTGFVEVHSDNPTADDFEIAAKKVRSLVNAPIHNPIALQWIKDQGGTGAIAKWE